MPVNEQKQLLEKAKRSLTTARIASRIFLVQGGIFANELIHDILEQDSPVFSGISSIVFTAGFLSTFFLGNRLQENISQSEDFVQKEEEEIIRERIKKMVSFCIF